MKTGFSSAVFTQALGWTLVHSIWQIACIFLIFKLAGWWLNRRNRLRYQSTLLSMGICAIWSILTFKDLYQSLQMLSIGDPTNNVKWFLPGNSPVILIMAIPENTQWTIVHWLDHHTTALGWVWCLGMLLLAMRLLGGYWLTCRLRRSSRPISDGATALHGQRLAKLIGVHKPYNFWRIITLANH